MKSTNILATLALTAAAAHAHKALPGPEAKSRPLVEVCFVLDTTGSMGGLIAGAKEKIWSIANDLTATKPAPELKISLVAYRDRGDDYVTKKFQLTDDLDAVYDHLMGFQAQGGGDSPESVNQGLHEAVTQMGWSKRKDALKLVFLVGDCPPHMDYQDDVQYPKSCKLAVKNGIIINTVQCGTNSSTTSVWKEIARASEGSYAAIEQSGGMAAIKTPVDGKIAELSRAINATVIASGSAQQQEAVRFKLSNASSAPVEAKAARSSFFADNLEGKAISGRGDLVTDFFKGKVDLDTIATEELPADYQKLGKKELKQIVMEKQAERKRLQAEMADLVSKRKAYVSKALEKREGTAKDTGFDAEIRRALKEQGARKGMEYSDK